MAVKREGGGKELGAVRLLGETPIVELVIKGSFKKVHLEPDYLKK